MAQFHSFQRQVCRRIVFAGYTITPLVLLLLWALVFAYAFIRQDRTPQLTAFWIVIVPLPLAFIVPVRGDAPLYLLLFGWAIIFAKVAFDLTTLISKFSVFVGKHLLGVATRATVGDAFINVFSKVFPIIATLLVAFAFAAFTHGENQRLAGPWLNVGAKTSHVIQTFRSLGLRGSRILPLFKENLFQNKWNAFFIASLVWNDHSLRIWVENADERTQHLQANVDYIITLSEFSADIVQWPEPSKSD
jgi:hypothetical protein